MLFSKIQKPKNNETVPTKFDNPKPVRPFELLVDTFGRPSYKELDPTMIFALTFPLFYGLMFGDVGHGIILAFIGLAFMKLAKTSQGTRNLGIIVLICGLFAILFGFVYGEAFGMGPEKQLEFTEKVFGKGNEFRIPTIYPQGPEGHRPGFPEINPIENPMGFLTIAVLLGSAHIISGLLMNLANKVIQKDYMGAIAGPIPKLWLFIGVVYLFMTFWTDFGKWGENIGLARPPHVSPIGAYTA